MRGRRLVSGAAAAALLVLGVGLSALPASAGCVLPCGGTFTIAAPAGLGFGSDWSEVTLTVEGSEVDLDTVVDLDLSGDVDLAADAVFVQVKDGATWDDVALTAAAGHLTGSLPQPGLVGAAEVAIVDLRVAVTGELYNPFDDEATLHTLTVEASLFAAIEEPSLRTSAVAPTPAETATADITVAPLDVTTDSDSATATVGDALPIDVKVANSTGAPYRDVVVLPLVDGVSEELTARASLRRLKSVAADTDTLVEFQKDGTWVDIADVVDPNELDVVDLAVDASHVTPWRFTYNDEDLDSASAIGWLATRFGGPVDDADPTPTLVSPEDSIDVVGFGVTDVTIVVEEPAVDNGSGNNDGSGGDDGSGAVGNELPATGAPIERQLALALGLLAAGALTVVASRRRYAPRHGLHRG